MHTIYQYQEYVSEYLESECIMKEPRNLYEPIHYILGLGGKRIRPVLTLMTRDFETDYKNLACCIGSEVFIIFVGTR
jgi:geranylgeranyl diphosphate synthase type II